MSRTHRHRKRIPKGYKTRAQGGHWFVIDKDGDTVRIGEICGTDVYWQSFRPDGVWSYKWGYEISPWELWKKAYFGKRKFPQRYKTVRPFYGSRGHWGGKEWRRFERKRCRRQEHMKVGDQEWELFVSREGKIPKRAQGRCYR